MYATVFISFIACSDEFTDSTLTGQLSDESLQSELGVNLLLTGTYSAMDLGDTGGFRASGDNWWQDAISDDAHKGSTDGDQQELLQL